MKNRIRNATVADIEQLADLFDQYRVFYEKKSDKKAARAFLTARISNRESEIFIALHRGDIVGFVQLYPLFSSTRMKRLWLLNDLFVRPEFRGQGFSIDLIEKAKELCRNTNACGMFLETAKSNDVGNNLYPKTDFNRIEDYNFYSWDV